MYLIMRICVSGTFGVTSLVNRLLFNTFSILHKPTILTSIYKTNGFELIDIPRTNSPVKCDLLILTCKAQKDIEPLARQWFGFHRYLIIAIYENATEEPMLCPEAHFVRTDNMSRDGIDEILRIIHTYKYNARASK